MTRNNETLELMLQAERRDIPIVDCLPPDPDHAEARPVYIDPLDPFDGITTIVEFVKLGMDFDKECRGEIDPVDQGHYLRGPNFDPMMDPDYWKEHQHYGENK